MSLKQAPTKSVLILARTITAVVSLTLAEGMLWVLGYPSWRDTQAFPADQFEPDRELGWKNRSGAFDVIGGTNVRLRYTNWSEGRRATAQIDSSDPRPRAVFVGDSYMFGYGLNDQDTFAWRYQERHPDVQVSNYGTPGYGTYQSYLAMKRALTRPAAAAFYLFNGFHEERNVADPSCTRVAKRAENGTFFPYAVLDAGQIQGRRSDGEQIWTLSRTLRTVAMGEEYYEMAKAWSRVHDKRAVTEALLAGMNQAAEGAGAKFTLILFDFRPKDRKTYREFLNSRGIAFLDCDYPELNDKRMRQADGHPDRKLNELLAQWIEAAPSTAHAGAAR